MVLVSLYAGQSDHDLPVAASLTPGIEESSEERHTVATVLVVLAVR